MVARLAWLVLNHPWRFPIKLWLLQIYNTASGIIVHRQAVPKTTLSSFENIQKFRIEIRSGMSTIIPKRVINYRLINTILKLKSFNHACKTKVNDMADLCEFIFSPMIIFVS